MGITEKHLRLRDARESAGYSKKSEAADALGVPRQTYIHHENGTRDFNDEDAVRYAKKFKVPVEWLVLGIEPMSHSSNKIREIDIRAGAGGGGIDDSIFIKSTGNGLTVSTEVIRDTWEFPDSFVRGELRMEPSTTWIIEVSGDSGYDPSDPHAPGSLFPGDKIIIDARDKRPSPPGPFVVHDGVGLVIKLVEVVPNTDPVRLRLSSRNPSYSPYEVTIDEANIIGRVRCRISVM